MTEVHELSHTYLDDVCSTDVRAALASHHHVLIPGPVSVGKTFLANALGHIACRRGRTVLMSGADVLLKQLKAARLDNSYDQEIRRVISVDLLILDDFALDSMDAVEGRDVYDIIVERHRRGSIIVTSNREPQEWLAMICATSDNAPSW